MDLDVAFVPNDARGWPPTACVVVDELRASSTITTVLDLGCAELLLAGSLAQARGLGRARGAILAGERRGRTPRGFQANNSPTELARVGVRDRVVVLSTSNGTAVLGGLATMPVVLVGCLLNARAVAEAAVELAGIDGRVGVVCAGVEGRFALDDAITAGVIVERLLETLRGRNVRARLTDTATAALRIRGAYPDLEAGLRESTTGALVIEIGAEEDIPFCARLDVTRTVGVLRPGRPARIERFRA